MPLGPSVCPVLACRSQQHEINQSPKRWTYGFSITQAVWHKYTIPVIIPCLNLVAIGDCEVGKAVDCEDGGVACALWLLVDEAIGVHRPIVAGYCRCATMESVDGHDEKAILRSWSNGRSRRVRT